MAGGCSGGLQRSLHEGHCGMMVLYRTMPALPSTHACPLGCPPYTAPHPTHPDLSHPADDEALARELDAELNPGARRTRTGRPAYYGERPGGGEEDEDEWRDDGEVRGCGAGRGGG